MQVINYTFKQYLELDAQEQNKVALYLAKGNFKPVDLFELGSFETSRSFGFVKDMQYYYNEGLLTWDRLFDLVYEETGLKPSKMAETGVYNLREFVEYCTQQIESINTKESLNLGHKPTPDEERAQIGVFSDYKSFPQFDALAQGDVSRFDDIRKIPYNRCFTKLMYDKQRADFDKRLWEIQNPANKNNLLNS